MTKVTKEEAKKFAKMTQISFEEQEWDGIVVQLNEILSYAERVVQIASQQPDITTVPKNVNMDRADMVVASCVKDILDQAPQQEDNYFVVPKFLDN